MFILNLELLEITMFNGEISKILYALIESSKVGDPFIYSYIFKFELNSKSNNVNGS